MTQSYDRNHVFSAPTRFLWLLFMLVQYGRIQHNANNFLFGGIHIMKNPLRWFLSSPDKPRIQDDVLVKRMYKRKRIQGIIAMVIGYSMYYVMRLPLSVAKKPLLSEGFNATQLGTIGAGMTIAIAFGKCFNGFMGDRCNIKKIVPFGLLGAAIINFILGLSPTNYFLFLALWIINGCFQSMGSAPCTVSISQWFPKSKMATWYGFFGVAHYLGEGLTYVGTAFIIASFGWRAAFYVPGIICVFLAFIIFHFMNDRPETYGLPSANEYAGETETAKVEKTKTTKTAQLEAIKNPFVWCVALSAIFLGITRYSMDSWGIIFLQEQNNYSVVTAGSIMAITSVTGAFGSIFSGIISDRIFKSRHAVTSIVFGLLMLLGVIGFCKLSYNQTLCMISTAVYGFALGIELSFLGGMLAVDLVSQKATGAAMGMVGLLAYFGATAQEIINGVLMDMSKRVVNGVTTYNFGIINSFWILSVSAMILLVVPVLFAKKKKAVSAK